MKEVCFTQGLLYEYDEYEDAYQVVRAENDEREELYILPTYAQKEVTRI